AMAKLEQERLELANDQIRLVFDGGTAGLLAVDATELGFACRGEAAPKPLFGLETVRFADHARFFQPEDMVSVAADASALQGVRVSRGAGGQRLVAEYSFDPGIRATLTVTLPDGSPVATMRLRVENPKPLHPSEAARVPRVTFPMVTGLRIGDDAESNWLATGRIQGEELSNPAESLPRERALQYPGLCCVPWQDLYAPQGGLFFGPMSDGTTQMEPVCGAEDGLVTLASRWWTVLEPGDVWESPPVELGVHEGAWHWGADRFREWSIAHAPPREQPDWLAECDGWFGLGGATYTFDELPEMLDNAEYLGLNYLQLWAQMILGNAYYCWFYPNPELGTEDDLKQALAEIHSRGGHVGFYSNAICFDAAIEGNEGLRELIDRYDLKDLPPLPNFYGEAERHVFVGPDGVFGRGGAAGHSRSGYPDGYWAMDPNSTWWQDYLTGWISKWHDEYGADVWYLDSFPVHGYGLGPASYSLHLDRPRSLGEGQIALLKRIREDFSGPLLYEGVACAAFMPWANWCLGTELSFGAGAWARPEICAYTFGDMCPIFSGSANTWTGIGTIWPDLEEPRREDAMNFVFLNGERFDVLGLHPLDVDDPFAQHLKALIALRAKVRDIVYTGRMLDSLGLSGMPAQVDARVFISSEAPGVVVATVDRRAERTGWELQINTAALPWPEGLRSCRALALDGADREVTLAATDGVLTVPMQPGEIVALRCDPA
ncbi:MAG TPA: DUF6259 domain-containing protein, partial [Armatimonadota bacterium]|nr:DUF6259 domain-containing protein [Armatimonadota bacterium]